MQCLHAICTYHCNVRASFVVNKEKTPLKNQKKVTLEKSVEFASLRNVFELKWHSKSGICLFFFSAPILSNSSVRCLDRSACGAKLLDHYVPLLAC